MPSIELDRSADTPVRKQLVEQLRYLIASGHFKVDDPLPSTRAMGDRLDLSFHTVRKAYQELQEQGVLRSKAGSGYMVQERAPLPKEERIEKGATIVHNTLRRLVGLGLGDAEIEALFQEQASLLDHAGLDRKLIVVGPHTELNELWANQLSEALQQTVRPVPRPQINRHQDADFAFTPHRHLTDVLEAIPRGDALGFVTHLPTAALERVVRLLDHETLGLVTRYQETIAPLAEALRSTAGFDGQVVAASIEDGVDHLGQFTEETDLLLYTPASHRRLRPHLRDAPGEHAEITLLVSQDSREAIVKAVPA
ncbi:MAG: GntR family transcriptional regulator [Salinibacter sp.]